MNEKICNCKGIFDYPHNDLRTRTALEKLLNNLDKVSIEDIEKLTEEL